MTIEQSESKKLMQNCAIGGDLENLVQILEHLIEDEKLNPALVPKRPSEILDLIENSNHNIPLGKNPKHG